MVFGRIILMVFLAVIGLGGRLAQAGVPQEAVCAMETEAAERQYGLPARLLNAISIVESGRYDRDNKATLAWPWTVTSGGDGKYFPTKAEAIAEVQRLRAKGVKNIDVGCMQINLMYHPNAFSSLEQAFNPADNVGYAARFLKGLFQSTGNWVMAASYYHSQTPSLAAAYRGRLLKVWDGDGDAGTQVASARLSPRQTPAPGRTQNADALRREWQEQQQAQRDEARRIANAYRQARIVEYQLRRARMVDSRRGAGAYSSGY